MIAYKKAEACYLAEVHLILRAKKTHKPFESISQVSGNEVTISEIGAHEVSKRRSKSVHPKASLVGS